MVEWLSSAKLDCAPEPVLIPRVAAARQIERIVDFLDEH